MSLSQEVWQQTILSTKSIIADAIKNLNQHGIKIVLVVDHHGKLQGTVSDGDIRRALLRGLDLKSSILDIVHRDSIVVPPELTKDLVMQLMVANKIQQIPIIDASRKVVGLHLWDQMSTISVRPNLMIIMAGGMGTRLKPYTENCPKPLLPIAGKPMLEHIVERAKLEGFRNFIFSVNYLAEMIEDYFSSGEKWGINIEYLKEASPMGTAGSLSLLNPRPDLPFIVTNGDVITDIQYGQLLDFHSRTGAFATMAVRSYEWQHPFGVVQTNGIEIVGFEEKPITKTNINAGVYALEPEALSLLNKNERCDMPSLYERIQLRGNRIVAYPMHEPWLDVGRPDDLSFANKQ